ncbi:MAG: metallopeptidase family protein [Chloroflexi bacterium]|nr:metallopeptidase family protein [Chloroflexota bacterium]
MQLSPGRFEELAFDEAGEILRQLPDELRVEAENVILEIEQRASRQQLIEVGLGPGQTLLGLYSGVPLVERHADSVLLQPDRITLFQGPLQAMCRTETELRARVRHTLIHELAHFFGRTDEELLQMGKY